MNRFIYGLVDPLDPGHVRYVGMAMRPCRPYHHANVARRQTKHSHLFHWIRLLQSEGREPAVLILEELREDTSRHFLGQVERMYIKALREIGHRLTNVAEGGYGGVATHHTPEFREKQRVRMTGHVVSEETRAKLRALKIGNKSKLGQKDSDETRARKSAALKGRSFPHQHFRRKPLLPPLTAEEKFERRHRGGAAFNHEVRQETREKLRNANLGKKASKLARMNMALGQVRRHYKKLLGQLEEEIAVREDSIDEVNGENANTRIEDGDAASVPAAPRTSEEV